LTSLNLIFRTTTIRIINQLKIRRMSNSTHFPHIRRLTFLLLLFTLSLTTNILAQSVSGKISDDKGDPLPGVSVIIKGTQTGVVSDIDGRYTLPADRDATLVFSYIGFLTREEAIAGRSIIDLNLETDAKALGEVVVVGYGTQKKVTVTGAVSTLQGEKIIKSPAVDISNSLAGRLPGLVVIQQSGEPGYDGATISIRGTNTLGNNSPLVVIDGIPDRDGGLGRLSPRDIDNISVLKDASAAIYGARAANGVILITTKRGKSGKPSVTYDFNQGWTQPATIPKMASSPQYAAIMNEIPIYKSIPANEWAAAWQSIKSTGSYKSPTAGISTVNANYSPEAVRKYTDGSDPWGHPNTDWFGDAFKTWSPQSRQNIQIGGGSESIKYMASMGYVNQDAYYKNSATRYQQYNFRTNVDARINQYINTNLGIMVRRELRKFPTESAGSIFRMLMRGRPTEPEVWPNGLPGPDIENGQNPYVITTNATGYQEDPTDFTQANGAVNITNPWVKGLTLTLSGAIDKNNRVTKTWQTPWSLYYWDKKTFEADGKTPKLEGAVRSNFKDPRLTQTYSSVLNTNLTAFLSYDKNFGSNNLSVMAGVTREKFNGEGFFAYRRNYISSAIDQLFAGGSLQQNTGNPTEASRGTYDRARLGYYGRAQYNFKEKYLAEFIWRYDGSYIFPESGRFGFFPGVLLGWNIFQEDFMKGVKGIDNLKLRASYGQMGNDQVFYNGRLQEYAFLSTYGFDQYPINNQVVTTLGETVLANPSFTWERANNLNIGLDGTILNNMIDFTFEYFNNRRDKILIQKTGSTPASSGINALLPPVNEGKVENKGFEFNLGFNNKAGRDLSFRFGVNGGFAKNRVIFIDEVKSDKIPAYQYREGKPINSIMVYQSDGVFRDQASIDANKVDYSAVTGKLIPGDMRFKDLNGDGKITGDDQERLEKNNTPTFNFGSTIDVRYKGFDLNILFQGAMGALIRVQTESGDIGNFLEYFYNNRWSVDNPSADHPRLASRGDTYYTGGNYGNNTYYLFSKDYIRLKNLELGYTLPSNLFNKVKLGGLRVYVNGLNLVTFTKQKVFDPEATAESGVYYPQSRVLNTGFSITF
jgi:TonB-dependent starch-binding outer membrane protein SusC